jgi:hypothetical protein
MSSAGSFHCKTQLPDALSRALVSSSNFPLILDMATAMQSAVRLPSPEAADAQSHTSGRKRSPSSRSPSPERRPPTLRTRSVDPDTNNDPAPPCNPSRSRSRSPLPHRSGPLPRDVDRQRALERQRQAGRRKGRIRTPTHNALGRNLCPASQVARSSGRNRKRSSV